MSDTPISNEDAHDDDAREAQEAAEHDEPKRRHKLSYETSLLREEAAAYLESLAQGLRSGDITLCQEDALLELAPASAVTMELRASQKGAKEKIQLEFSWYSRNAPAVKLVSK